MSVISGLKVLYLGCSMERYDDYDELGHKILCHQQPACCLASASLSHSQICGLLPSQLVGGRAVLVLKSLASAVGRGGRSLAPHASPEAARKVNTRPVYASFQQNQNRQRAWLSQG